MRVHFIRSSYVVVSMQVIKKLRQRQASTTMEDKPASGTQEGQGLL